MRGVSNEKRYPMHTLEAARQSANQAALDFHHGRITKQVYAIVRSKLEARIRELEDKKAAPGEGRGG